VPEVSAAPNRSISSFGNSSRTSSHVWAGSDFQICASSSVVSESIQSASGLTTTVSASVAAMSSTYSTPFSAHSSSSAGWIGRLALLKSVSPVQKKFEKPPPDPVELMSGSTPGCSSAKSSMTALISGNTVLDPAMLIGPESSSPPSEPSPPSELWVQPASPSAPAPAIAASDLRRVIPVASASWLEAITCWWASSG
jgi:hypothetical protein